MWTAVLVVALAVLCAMLFAALTTPPRCSWIDAERISDEKLETLTAEGWYSIAGDDKEALYSPGCLAPGSGV